MSDYNKCSREGGLDFETLSSAGDVLAARQLAKRLLEAATAPCETTVMAQLILTAACLHISSPVDADPTLEQLSDCLSGIAVDPNATLGKSRLQFVQYVALEIAELDPGAVSPALLLAARAVASQVGP
jgi:hypothetical protein